MKPSKSLVLATPLMGASHGVPPFGRILVPYHQSGMLGSERVVCRGSSNSHFGFPTPGSNRKAAKRRAGIQTRHGKAARK